MTRHKGNIIWGAWSSDVANGGGPPHDSGMEARVAKLEETMTDVRERLARIETRLSSTATQTDIANMESRMVRWFAGTTLSVIVVIVAVAAIAIRTMN